MTACRFSTSASIWLLVAVTPARLPLSPKFSEIASPEASATVPMSATITPVLRTSGASSAM